VRPGGWPAGEGEMALLVRTHDWAKTPLGPIDAWPQSLRTIVDLMLSSEATMSLVWGGRAIQLYNDAYARLIGPRHPNALGRSPFETFPEVRLLFERHLAEAMAGRAVQLKDQFYPFVRNDVVEDAWFDISYNPVRGEGGEVAGVLAIMTETTERVLAERRRELAEAELREREGRYRLAVEAADLGRWELVPETGEFYTSSTCNRHLGLPEDAQPTHEAHFKNIHPDDHAMIYERLRRAVEEGGEFEAEYRVIHPGGEVRQILSRARVLHNPSSTRDRLTGITLDVTVARELEEERERARARQLTALAEAAERERVSRELHDRVAHQMGVAHQSLELFSVLSESDPERAAEKLALAKQTTRRALDQTRALSAELKRLQGEKLSDGLESAFGKLAESYVPDGIEMGVSFSGEQSQVPGPVETQVYLTMREAIRNAVRHSGCSRIGVSLEFGDGELRGRVEDDGEGFDPRAVEEATPSWGVGLRSMRERLEMLGGSLRVESEPGVGTKVEMRVPLDGRRL
jgi:signal transduction histidine kinase